MISDPPGFFQGTEMPRAGWWEALWPDLAAVLAAVGVKPGMEVIDLCSGDGWTRSHLPPSCSDLLGGVFEAGRAFVRRQAFPF